MFTGLVLLEMETGQDIAVDQFEGEVYSGFVERNLGEGVRSIVSSIFVEGSATVEGLLANEYFQVKSVWRDVAWCGVVCYCVV